jgi:hypothetical protein
MPTMQSAQDQALHVFFEEKQTGPFPVEAVRQMLQVGSLNSSALVWHEGMTDWQPIEDYLAAPAAAIRVESPIRAVPVETAPAQPQPVRATVAATTGIETVASSRKRAYGEPNLQMGALGAVLGGLVGMTIWFVMLKCLNVEIGLIAWGVGGLVGFGCRVLGGGYSRQLGWIAALCALVAIVGGEFLATKAKFGEYLDKMIGDLYVEQMNYAKQAVSKTTDEDLRTFLVTTRQGSEAQPKPATVTPEDLEQFRSKEMPNLKDFINGHPSKAEFDRAVRQKFNSGEMHWIILKSSLSLWTALWLFLGIGTAWRLGTGQTE